MILFHTIRAFLQALVLLPCITSLCILAPLTFFMIHIYENWFNWCWFNPVRTYKALKENEKLYEGEYHTWTGRRIK